ncbi:hypothetical protein K440DRAFT_625520 [Wilcoxina mikolae CBS 423.85]|nr:hypothetical protein K440DRAFT_625520 [Wilcoxina mikolae CBS 423.85]
MIDQDLPTRYISKEVLVKFLEDKWPQDVKSVSIEDIDGQYWRITVPEKLSDSEIKKLQSSTVRSSSRR